MLINDFQKQINQHERSNSILSNLSDFYYKDESTNKDNSNIPNGIVIELENKQDTKRRLILSSGEDNSDQKNNLKGFLLLVFSVFMYSVANLISKYLSIYYPTLENLTVNLFRGVFLMLISRFFIYVKDINYKEQLYRSKYKTNLLLFRCFFGATANIALFEAFKFMRISSAFTIFCTYPIFVSIITIIYLKSKFSYFDILSYIACITAVIFISKPVFIFPDKSSGNDSAYGVLIAFFAALANAIGVIINKSIAFDFDYLLSTFLFGNFFLLESAILLPFTEYGISTLNFINFIWCTILAFVFFFGLSTFVLALNIGNPVKILPATYFGIVFSLIYNTFIFDKPTDFLDFLGSGMIIFFNTLGNCNIKL